jgi:hypothetical protein
MPLGHKVQDVEPASDLYEPAAHALHAAFVAPGFLIVPVYPGAQMVHEETDVLPRDEPVVNVPVGHEIQFDHPVYGK